MKTYTQLAQPAIRRDNLIPTNNRNMQDKYQLVKEVQECLLIGDATQERVLSLRLICSGG
jgi:hypothetical protein